jgi:hypothetical protein
MTEQAATWTERESLGVIDCWTWAREIKAPAKKPNKVIAAKSDKKSAKAKAEPAQSWQGIFGSLHAMFKCILL